MPLPQGVGLHSAQAWPNLSSESLREEFLPNGKMYRGEREGTYQVGVGGILAESEALLTLAIRVPVQLVWSQGFVILRWE